MKKTILCAVVGTIFASYASAAVLNVEGEIQLNGHTVFEPINLSEYFEKSGTYVYTAEKCDYEQFENEPLCQTFTKTRILLIGDGQYNDEYQIANEAGEVVEERSYIESDGRATTNSTSSTVNRNIEQTSPQWVNSAGEPILYNGQPVFPGMYIEGNCDDSGFCESTSWAPSEGDYEKPGENIYTKFTSHNIYTSEREFSLLVNEYPVAVMKVPAVHVLNNKNGTGVSESWEVIDGKKTNYHSSEYTSAAEQLITTLTPIYKMAEVSGFNDCVMVTRSDGFSSNNRQVLCKGVGLIQGQSNMGHYGYDWTLIKQ